MDALLSPGWFATLARRLGEVRVGTADGARLRLGVRVKDAPGGSVTYIVELGGAQPCALDLDEAASADVTLVESYETAERIASGALIADELALGAVKLEGNVQKLLAAQADLAELSGLLAS